MTLRAKALVIISVALLGLAGIIYGTSRLTFIRGLEEIERNETSDEVGQALSALSHRISEQETYTANWASWDDTYTFIEDKNEAFIRSNLVDDTFATIKLNIMVFSDLSGETVYSKAFDLTKGQEIPVPAEFLKHVSGDSPLLGRSGEQNFTSGIISLKDGPIIVTAQPILTSERKGPTRGTLVFARYLDSGLIEEISKIITFPIAIRPIDNIAYADFKEAFVSLSQDTSIYMKAENSQTIAGYTLLHDIYGRPSSIMKVELPRDAFQLGQTATSLYVLTILGTGILVAALTLVMIQKQVLSRFANLIRGIDQIAESGNTSTRINLGGRDELSLVAGTINGMLAAIQEAGTEIRNSERQYRLLAENVTDVIWTTDNDLNFTYISPSVIQLTGYPSSEAVGLTFDELLEPDSLKPIRKAFTDAMSTEYAPQSEAPGMPGLEVEIIRKDSSRIWTEIKLSAIRDSDNDITGFAGVARDITERRQAAQDLQKQYEQERTLRQQLEEEVQKRIEFTRALVHELKTPITPVLAAVELLLDEVTDERLVRLVQNIDRSASNLNQRIDELLDLARGEIDTLELDLETQDLLPLLNDIISEMTPVGERYGQVLTAELPDTLPEITADEGRLRQVILNILSNAFKFTPAGGNVTIRAKVEKNNLIVEVEDTGPGISQEDQKRLFDPYFRRPGDRERLSGLGLGLALSKSLVELHGGEMWVTSQKGKGSTFSFSIPLDAAKQRGQK